MPATLATVAARTLTPPDSTARRVIDQFAPMTNVSETERWLALGGAAYLFTFGFSGRGPGLTSLLTGGYLLYRAASGHCMLYQAMGMNTAGWKRGEAVIPAGKGKKVEHSVVVNRPVEEVYRFWRDFENLPRFMRHLEDVDTSTDNRSRWIAKGPMGLRVEWEAELTADTPNQLIAWKSLPGADVDTAGSVHFLPTTDHTSTEVKVSLKYDPPAGAVGTAVAKLFGEDPERQVREDLQKFKEIMENRSV
ncbi:MAG: SRPBCC family protein [Fimbriiglobus sp.]|jgi:uncharacterized membrane protein|nr:SRPBCC family protein [Fimbriiglobus sp.]